MDKPSVEILKALRAFRKDLGVIPKNSRNPFYKSMYTSLEDIQKAIEPILDQHGLTLHASFKEVDSGSLMVLNLYHDEGSQMPTSEYRIRCKQTKTNIKDDKKGTTTTTEVIDNPQDAGSGITYALRYCISIYLGLVLDDDDDGNRASGNTQRGRQSSQDAPGAPPNGRAGSKTAEKKKEPTGSGSADQGMGPPSVSESAAMAEALSLQRDYMKANNLSDAQTRKAVLDTEDKPVGAEAWKAYTKLLKAALGTSAGSGEGSGE